jgi:chromosome segregation protein
LADWQARQDAYARDSHDASRAAEVERARIELLDKQTMDADRRLGVLAEERGRNEAATIAAALGQMQDEEGSLRERLDAATADLETRRQVFVDAERNEQQSQQQLADLRRQDQTLRGRLASLEALQHAALGDDQPERRALIERLGLTGNPRLGEALKVDAGWEAAVETVLAGWLDAAVQGDPEQFVAALADEAEQGITVIADTHGDGQHGQGTLAARAKGPAAAMALLGRVHTAPDVEIARRQLHSLAHGETVITPDGIWIGRGFVRTVRGGGAQAGMLSRENELAQIRASLADLGRQQAELDERLAAGKDAKRAAEIERDDAQRTLYQAHRALSEIAGQLSSHQGRLETAEKRLAQIGEETLALGARLELDQTEVRAGRARLEQAMTRMGELEIVRGALDSERRGLLESREQSRTAADRARAELHGVDRELEARRSALASLQQAMNRMQSQREQLRTRADELAVQLEQSLAPQAELDVARQTTLDQRVLVDKDLAAARETLEAGEAEFRQREQSRHRLEREASEARERIGNARMQVQAIRLRAEALASAVVDAGFDSATLMSGLAEDADVQAWARELESLDQKIRRLEPVNLAAIQEFEEQSRRKDYLDAQNGDLTSALEILENAIRKIDRETRSRFKDTFDRVNAGVQQLFPRLFGGGHAYLELTGDDLLTTGVAIMARPPGKRVSNISLLSGGEKALTAASLVFAIFRLNPAPFCLLDEVDAPLDEANVGRFCDLVKEMSDNVQFLCVTHNKVTMEAARQLCGVTMREPGVSRLVTVDLAEATELAGAA